MVATGWPAVSPNFDIRFREYESVVGAAEGWMPYPGHSDPARLGVGIGRERWVSSEWFGIRCWRSELRSRIPDPKAAFNRNSTRIQQFEVRHWTSTNGLIRLI